MTQLVVICSWKSRILSLACVAAVISRFIHDSIMRACTTSFHIPLCETGFSTPVHKSKTRNKLDVEDDMRLAISETQRRIVRSAHEFKRQIAH